MSQKHVEILSGKKNRFFCIFNDFSARFIASNVGGMTVRSIQVGLGEVVARQFLQEMTTAEIQAHIDEALGRGYQEVTESEFDTMQTDFQTEFERKAIEPEVRNARRVEWSALKDEFRGLLKNCPDEYLSPKMCNFHVYDQQHRCQQDLRLTFSSYSATPQTATRNLIFSRGLTVDGTLDAGDGISELPLFLIVRGNLSVKHLILIGWIEVVVTGSAIVEGTLLCMDGESGGRLHVMGDLESSTILGGMMFPIEVGGRVSGRVFWSDDEEASLADAQVIPSNLSHAQSADLESLTPLVAGAYCSGRNWVSGQEVQTLSLDHERMVALMRRGESLFR